MQPLILEDAFKTFTIDQDKLFSPEETVKHFRAKLDVVHLDLLEEVRRIDNGRLGIPVYISRCGSRRATHHRDQETDGQRGDPPSGGSQRRDGTG